MSLQLHRPDGKGGLEKRTAQPEDWRSQLRSPRWGSALKGGRLPKMANSEMNPTSTLGSILFWAALAGLTFVLLLVGYGSGAWK